MNFSADVYGSQRMNPNNSGDPLTFPLASPAGKVFTYPVKYLNIHLMNWYRIWYIHGSQMMYPNDFEIPRLHLLGHQQDDSLV